MDAERKSDLSTRIWNKVRKWVVVLIVFFAIIAVIFWKGYSDATSKYENVVADLRQQVADLEDQLSQKPIDWDDMPTKEITIDLIKSEINDIGELATLEYLYTDAGKFQDPKELFGISIPFTTKSFIAKWNGTIKAGVKVDEIIVEINDAQKEIIIHMPKAEILSHQIDSNSIETLDEKDGLFNKVKVEDVRQFDAVSKEAMEERAIENGIIDKAFENAKDIIKKLVYNDVVQEQGYIISFEMLK